MMLKLLRESVEVHRESRNPFWKFFYGAKDQAYKIAVVLQLRKPSNAFVQVIAAKGHPIPKVFIETGTYHGKTTFGALRDFIEIHTIELSEEWYEKAVEQFKGYAHVHCHHGDSAKVLSKILPGIKEPVLFYLDAHYSGGTTAMGSEQNPLLRELEIIGKRPYEDIIFIDDLEQMGREGTMGTKGHPFYPPSQFDWRDITRESIERALGRKILNWEEKQNKLIIWKME